MKPDPGRSVDSFLVLPECRQADDRTNDVASNRPECRNRRHATRRISGGGGGHITIVAGSCVEFEKYYVLYHLCTVFFLARGEVAK